MRLFDQKNKSKGVDPEMFDEKEQRLVFWL